MNTPSFGQRIALAFSAFFKILFDGEFAGRVLRSTQPDSADEFSQTAPSSEVEEAPVELDTMPVPPMEPATHTEPMVTSISLDRKALQLIGALQRDGRFVDFIMQDLNQHADAEIGAVARVVHGGCRRVMQRYMSIDPVWPGDEGSQVTVDDGFDRQRISLTGNVSGEPPFTGTLEHAGWYASQVDLPDLTDAADPFVLMPAEIEL
ncbi:MAG: hypothetical protein CMH52_05915 [Myxococcales bacterium]|nr:hypothetical protein [Myxococcales bacterium]|tara:strand:- start:327 stop:944 length:618 start_codon:yes stop_codon:yes gene_type:complete